jgi:lysozyme
MASFSNSRLKQGGAIAGGLSVLALTIQLIGGHEGLRTKSYRDVVGVWTECYGHTVGARAGLVFTKAECDKQFGEDLLVYEQQMRSCLDNPDSIPIKSYIAFLDTEYNIGKSAFCNSSIAAAANTGNIAVACDRILRYTMAGGRRIAGLVRRRQETRAICLQGVNEG